MTFKTMVTKDGTSTEPIIAREGDEKPIKITVEGVVTVILNDADLVMYMYKEGQQSDVASTYFTGSMSVSGIDTIITKQSQNLKAGNYVISVFANIDGDVECAATIPFIVKRRSER